MFSKTLLTFLKDEKPFYPIISESKNANTEIVTLNCSLGSDLNWEIKDTDKAILWNLDFDFLNLSFPIDNKLQFESLKIAVEIFTKNIYPKYKDQTLGVCLYQGSTSVFSIFENNPDVFVDYLRLFFSSLDDQVMPFLIFDTMSIADPVEFCRLFRKERFEYFSLIFRNPTLKTLFCFSNTDTSFLGYIGSGIPKISKPPTLGFVFPTEEKISSEINQSLQEVFSYLKDKPFRLIYETHLIEDIDCIDTLIVLEEGLSNMGKRQIQGFLAAGGQVVDFKGLKAFSG